MLVARAIALNVCWRRRDAAVRAQGELGAAGGGAHYRWGRGVRAASLRHGVK
jgi:hypothetical protein